MVRFLIHHTADGKSVFFSQFYGTNITAERLEAAVEILRSYIRQDRDREGVPAGDAQRLATFVVDTLDFSNATNKAFHDEFEGLQVVYCDLGSIVVSLGLDPTDSAFIAQGFLTTWIAQLKRHFKTNVIVGIYERVDEICALLSKLLPLGQLLLTNPTYLEYLKNEAVALTRAM